MRITIDSALCEGHGRCVELLPDVFEFGADGMGKVRAGAAHPTRDQIDRVAALCPTLAISVQDA